MLKGELATQFVALAEKQGASALSLIGHRLTGTSLFYTGNIVECQSHLDHAIELYNANEHRPLATRFGQDIGVTALCARSLALAYRVAGELTDFHLSSTPDTARRQPEALEF
jgi:hypothetical protein